MMKSLVYVFGNLGKGYEQYPNDDAREALQSLYAYAVTDSQMVVHREDNQIYYGYIQKLYDRSQYIGLCIVLDGIMFSTAWYTPPMEKLFSIFDNAVENLAKSNVMLEYNERGDLFSRVTTLNEAQGEAERIISTISYDIKLLECFTAPLPSVSNVVMNQEGKTIYIGEVKPQEIEKAIVINSYTCILRGESRVPIPYSSHEKAIEQLQQKIGKVIVQYDELEEKYEKRSRQHTSWIVFLTLICCILAGLLIYVKFF